MVKSFAGDTGEGIVDQSKVDILPDDTHDGVMEYPPREVFLLVNDPVLAGVIMHVQFFVIGWREFQSQDHPLEGIQVRLGVLVMSPDVPVGLHLPRLSFLVSRLQVVHVGNLFKDVSFSSYHTSIFFRSI